MLVEAMIIAILTPIKIEHTAILSQLVIVNERIIDGSRYVIGQFDGIHQSFTIVTLQSGVKNETTTLATEKVIRLFNPIVVILAGIAGGIKDVEIGDIVVGTKYYGYEFGKDTKDGFTARPESGSYSKELIVLAQSVSEKQNWKQRAIKASTSKVVFGPIASGNKVLTTTDSDTFQFLRKNYNDSVIIEMEGLGFGQVIQFYPSIRFLNVRGISDLLEGKSLSDESGCQEWSADNMAAFVFELLYQLDVSKFRIIGSMDIKRLSKKIIKLILPTIRMRATQTERNLEQQGSNSIQELYDKIVPLLSDDSEELIKLLDSGNTQTPTWMKLKRALEKETELLGEIEPLIRKVELENFKLGYKKNIIKDSTISVSGDFQLGDKG